jgi:RND superfamily putative drug exporter
VKPTAPLLERWTRRVVRWRVLVIGLWLAVIVTGAAAAYRLPPLLSTSLAVPGTSSQQAAAILEQHFGQNPDGTFTVVFRVARPQAATMHLLDERLVRAAGAVPTGRATPLRAVAGIVFGAISTSIDLQRAATYTPAVRQALAEPLRASGGAQAGRSPLGRTGAAPPTFVTGPPALQYDINPVLATDLVRGEVVAVIVALVLLVLLLGASGAVVVPFVFAAATITATLGIVYGLAHVMLMMLYVPNLVQLIGLGLAVDYSLLVVHRFREELTAPDRPVEDAVVATMASAGRTVLVSAAAVALGLGVVVIVPVPFVRSLGVAGVLVPAVSVVAVLSLQPALLSLLGRRGTRAVWPARPVPLDQPVPLHQPAPLQEPALPQQLAPGSSATAVWSRLARRVVARPLPFLAGAAILLAAAAAPVAGLQLTPGAITAIPKTTNSARGLALLSDRVGSGLVTPVQVVIDSGVPGGARRPAVAAATLRMAQGLLNAPDVFVVAIGSHPPYMDSTGRYRTITVVAQQDFGAEATQRLVHQIRAQYVPGAHFPTGAHVYVGGAPAEGADFLARVYGAFGWLVLAMLAVAYLVLVRAWRSLVLPLVALALDACSVLASYGLTVVVFRYGVGHDLLGLYHVPQIEGWVPAFLFAVLFGLSMDYQMFFVRRMREGWDGGADNSSAIVYGLASTGRVVTTAALIMVGALFGLVGGQVAGLQELGVGLSLGALLDATVVRGLLMPSVMALIGPRNWWLPASVARLLRVEASPFARAKDEASLFLAGDM